MYLPSPSMIRTLRPIRSWWCSALLGDLPAQNGGWFRSFVRGQTMPALRTSEDWPPLNCLFWIYNKNNDFLDHKPKSWIDCLQYLLMPFGESPNELRTARVESNVASRVEFRNGLNRCSEERTSDGRSNGLAKMVVLESWKAWWYRVGRFWLKAKPTNDVMTNRTNVVCIFQRGDTQSRKMSWKRILTM